LTTAASNQSLSGRRVSVPLIVSLSLFEVVYAAAQFRRSALRGNKRTHRCVLCCK
jgi:hypothetical protein